MYYSNGLDCLQTENIHIEMRNGHFEHIFIIFNI